MLHLTPLVVAGWALALFGGAIRLAPYTEPFWSKLPKWLQAWLPSGMAGLPTAYSAFQNVKTWMDAVQATLITVAVLGAFAVPGASSPHNHPDQMAAYLAKKQGKPPTIPPLMPWLPMLLTFLLALLMTAFFMIMTSCAALPAVKAADQAAVMMCADFYGKQKPSLSLDDVIKDFCTGADVIAPFLAEERRASMRAGARVEALKTNGLAPLDGAAGAAQ